MCEDHQVGATQRVTSYHNVLLSQGLLQLVDPLQLVGCEGALGDAAHALLRSHRVQVVVDVWAQQVGQ